MTRVRWESSIAVVTLLSGLVALASAPAVQPGDPVDHNQIVIYPDRWKELDPQPQLYPWTGEELVFLTTDPNLNADVMGGLVGRLNDGWRLYAELTGRRPSPFKRLNGKPTITAVPEGRLTCGYGCGYIGTTGIEVAGFYNHDYPLLKSDPNAMPHYYFYEMGRNFYTFGDRHSAFITGYAVFMRYVCMDVLGCADPDAGTRRTIETAEKLFAESDMDFLKGFTAVAGLGEKAPRLKDKDGKWISPSDQPVLYASAMLKLRRECGGEPWLKRFYRHLATCPEIKPDTEATALRQSLSWLVCASLAAKKDLSSVFADRWRMPLPPETRHALSAVDWRAADLSASRILKGLPPGETQ
jgi:hypothetical protein